MSEISAVKAGNALKWKFFDQIGGKLIFLVRLLVLARMLVPEDFGLVAIALAIIALFTTLTDFGIVPALIHKADPNDDDYHTAWSLGVIRAGVVTLVILVAGPWIAEMFGDSRAGPIVQFLAIGIFVDALSSIRVIKFNRELDFKALAILNISRALASTTVAILLAASFGVWAMVAGSLVGSLMAMLGSYVMGPIRPMFRISRESAITLFSFGRWLFLAAILVILANVGLRAIISRELGVEALGVFYLALRIAALPAQGVIDVFTPVSFSAYARMQNSSTDARNFLCDSLKGFAITLLPACILLGAIAATFVDHILGPQWEAATLVIQLVLLGTIVGALGDALTPLFQGFGRPDFITALELLQSAAMLTLAWFLAPILGLPGVVIGVAGATLLTQFPGIIFAHRLLHSPFSGTLRPAAIVLVIATASGFMAWGIGCVIPGFFGLTVSGLVGSLGFLFLIQLVDARLRLGLIDSLIRFFPWLERYVIFRRGAPNNI